MVPDLDRTIDRRRSTWALAAIALVLVVLLIACGSSSEATPAGTTEFDSSSESIAETSLGWTLEEILGALASGLWTGLTPVVCRLAQWWFPLVAFVAVFLLRLKRSRRYQASRYALSTALAFGAAAGAVALLIAMLCWMF